VVYREHTKSWIQCYQSCKDSVGVADSLQSFEVVRAWLHFSSQGSNDTHSNLLHSTSVQSIRETQQSLEERRPMLPQTRTDRWMWIKYRREQTKMRRHINTLASPQPQTQRSFGNSFGQCNYSTRCNGDLRSLSNMKKFSNGIGYSQIVCLNKKRVRHGVIHTNTIITLSAMTGSGRTVKLTGITVL
jgi:hypothetical protein